MEGKIKLYEGLELTVKKLPNSEDLQNLADFGIDLLSGVDYGVVLLESFRDMEKMRTLVGLIFEGDIPEVIEPKVTGPAINEALRSFFGKFGLSFL